MPKRKRGGKPQETKAEPEPQAAKPPSATQSSARKPPPRPPSERIAKRRRLQQASPIVARREGYEHTVRSAGKPYLTVGELVDGWLAFYNRPLPKKFVRDMRKSNVGIFGMLGVGGPWDGILYGPAKPTVADALDEGWVMFGGLGEDGYTDFWNELC